MARFFIPFLSMVLLAAPVKSEEIFTSLYSDIKPASCRAFQNDERVQKCSGIQWYSLLVEDRDGRQSISIMKPDAKLASLRFKETVTAGFSTVGEKAEWRVMKSGSRTIPVALIVRVIAYENPQAPEKKTEYLVVSKITPENICVVGKVKASVVVNANAVARELADISSISPCV